MHLIGAAVVLVAERMDSRWPPVLTGLVVVLVIGGVTVVTVMFRSLREGARQERQRPRGYER